MKFSAALSYSSLLLVSLSACGDVTDDPASTLGGSGGRSSSGGAGDGSFDSSGGAANGTGGVDVVGGGDSGGVGPGGTASGGNNGGGSGGEEPSSGGTTSGGRAATGGSSATGGSGSGGGSNLPQGCSTVIVASGVPAMIDDFDHAQFPNFVSDGDGRVGTWEHKSWSEASAPVRVSDGADTGHLRFSCGAVQNWCNSAWDQANPWGQWAALTTLLGAASDTEPSCYDASVHTGIRFDARSLNGNDRIQLLMFTTESNPDQGWTYRSPTYSLNDEWEQIEVPFLSVSMPAWVANEGGPSGSVDPRVLIGMSFVVRTVQDVMSGSGEILLPYDIELDNIRFY